MRGNHGSAMQQYHPCEVLSDQDSSRSHQTCNTSVSNKSHLPKIFPHVKTVYVIQDPVTQQFFFPLPFGPESYFWNEKS